MGLKFALAGGDLRNVKLAAILAEQGCEVYTFGISHSSIGTNFNRCADMGEAFAMGDFIIGPTPFSHNGSVLNAPLHTTDIPLSDVLKNMPKGRTLIAGKIPAPFFAEAAARDCRVIDILKRDDMAILNAIPTAEGAIQIAMEEVPVTLHNCKILILGMGKIGTALALRLKALGAAVTVCVRKSRDSALGESQGLRTVTFDRLAGQIKEYKVIYNTVPAVVLDKNELDNMASDSLLVDLASLPGGVNFEYAREKNIKTVQALSLPGKVAPETSAENMAKVIFNIIKELAGEAAKNVN